MVSRSRLRIGVLTEDRTDSETIEVLIRRIAVARGAAPGTVGLKARSGGGCAQLQKKAQSWMRQLVELEACARRCPAFHALTEFVAGLLPD